MVLARTIFLIFFNIIIIVNAWPQNALIIIDMQSGFTDDYYYYNDLNPSILKEIIANQVEAIEQAKREGIPIVVLEVRGEGMTNSNLIKALGDYKYLRLIKNTTGAFESPTVAKQLNKYLADKEVKNLIIGGANGKWCVKSTIDGAINCGYKVIAVSDLIADFTSHKFLHPFEGYYDEFKGPNFREVKSIKGCLTQTLSSLTKAVP